MSPTTGAVLLLIIGNLLATFSDVAVKLLELGISPFQYMFLRQLVSLLVIAPLWWCQPLPARVFVQKRITCLRAHLVLIGSGCTMMALSYLPIATANAIFYAAPLLMLPLAVVILNERASRNKVLSTVFGFIGVLVVLRPSQFHWAALFALGTACTLALFNLLVRKLPSEQSVITTLWWTTVCSLPISLILAINDWRPLSMDQITLVAVSAVCILSYNGLAVAAYRKAPPGDVALSEYSGLVFAALFGILWFGEVPDWLTAIGILMIIVPLMPWRSRNARHLPRKAQAPARR
ncbi:DMT family transporter [Vibrio sp. SM6]|uniref:DMT family transporter n=1 Tax=Vibrio agarilyticus TaxID=2726741 RepID=A0A7X8YGI0_9VIBR|nr:DMT family transporter [Vibrio agarilyticus]NLS12431.1 DMT family transporter [Vibrio agarilyticus]